MLETDGRKRKVFSQVPSGEAPEVSLATKTWLLGEDGERKHLAVAQCDRTTRSPRSSFRVVDSPPVVYEHIQRGEEGVEVHPLARPRFEPSTLAPDPGSFFVVRRTARFVSRWVWSEVASGTFVG